MADTTEQALADAILEGGLTALTLWPTPDGRWQGNARRGDGWRVKTSDDPVDALRGAISAPAQTNNGDIFD